MRAQSSSSRAFGFCPLMAIADREANASVGRRTVSVINLEPDTRLLHCLQPGSALTAARQPVWLRRRLYWLRCRIVNANNTQGQVPTARPPGPRQDCDIGCGVRDAVAGG